MKKVRTYSNEDFKTRLSEFDKQSGIWQKTQVIFNKYPFQDWVDYDWRVHDGDLEVDHTFVLHNGRCGGCLIVTGNLTIKGSYVDGCFSSLIVLGDMVAENIITEYPIYVQGNVEATGLILCHYNDYFGEFCGKVNAQSLFIFDRSFRILGEKMCSVRNDPYFDKNDTGNFVDEIFDIDDNQMYLACDLLTKILKQGKSIYK